MERQAHFVTKHLVANKASRAVNTRGPCHVVVYVMESTFGVVWSGISELRPEMNVKGGAICRSVGSGKSRQRGKKKPSSKDLPCPWNRWEAVELRTEVTE